MTTSVATRRDWSVWITRLIGLWVLTGAGMKLVWGTPDNLPEFLRDLPLDLLVTYRVAIAAELCIGLLALLRPRWSWLLVIVLMLAFITVLVLQTIEGEASCGCFGEKLPVSPPVMLAIDGVLLILLIAARPWATPGSDATGGLIAIVVVVGAAVLPWWLNRDVETPDDIGNTILNHGHVTIQVGSWPGERLQDTRLWPWLEDLDLDVPLPDDALWMFYRESCEWCSLILDVLAEELGQRQIVLLKLPPVAADEESKLHRIPEGVWVHHVTLHAGVAWTVVPPALFETKDGRVLWAEEGVSLEAFDRLNQFQRGSGD